MMEADAIKGLFSSYYDMSKTCAEEVIKRLKDDEQNSYLEKLESGVRQVSDKETKTRKEAVALEVIENDVNNSDVHQSDVDKWGDLSQLLEEKLAQSNTSESWTGGLKDYQAHIQKVFNNLELEDMIVASSDSNIDPYSKKPIQHPVRTKFCKHIFDKTTVLKLLTGKGRLRCPYMGCLTHFTAKDLVDMSDHNDTQEESD